MSNGIWVLLVILDDAIVGENNLRSKTIFGVFQTGLYLANIQGTGYNGNPSEDCRIILLMKFFLISAHKL